MRTRSLIIIRAMSIKITMMIILVLMLMIREMIERSGAYTREEPVASIGKTITEVENINSMKIFKWARSSLSFTVCNCRMTKRTWSTGWLTGSLVLPHPHPRFKDLYFSNHHNHRNRKITQTPQPGVAGKGSEERERRGQCGRYLCCAWVITNTNIVSSSLSQ